MSDQPTSFWTTLPGILTGLAGLIAAVSGLITVLFTVGFLGSTPAKTPIVVDMSAKQTVALPAAGQDSTEAPAKAAATELAAGQNAALEAGARAAKAVDDLIAKSANPPKESGKVAFEMTVEGKTIPVLIEAGVASAPPSELAGKWRRTELLIDLPQDVYLDLKADGNVTNWVENSGKMQVPRSGKWDTSDGKLVFRYDGFTEESEAYSLYEGQLVYPNVEGRRGFWDRVE
jgi:hypothetical protein